MEREVMEILNQDLILRVKEIRDTFGAIDVELGLANQSTINALRVLADSLERNYVEEDIARFAKSVLQKTTTIKSLLTYVDEVARDLLITVTEEETE